MATNHGPAFQGDAECADPLQLHVIAIHEEVYHHVLEKLQDPFHIRRRERRSGLRSIDELIRMYRPARDQTRM